MLFYFCFKIHQIKAATFTEVKQIILFWISTLLLYSELFKLTAANLHFWFRSIVTKILDTNKLQKILTEKNKYFLCHFSSTPVNTDFAYTLCHAKEAESNPHHYPFAVKLRLIYSPWNFIFVLKKPDLVLQTEVHGAVSGSFTISLGGCGGGRGEKE